MDEYTKVSYESWGSRLMGSITGVLIGILMFLAAFPLLWWNEGRAVTTEKSLKEGKAAVVSIRPDKVDPAHDGKLVHFTGQATSTETLKDPRLPVSAPTALALVRQVEMYQWKETVEEKEEKQLGGGTKMTRKYKYDKQWSSTEIDSDRFDTKQGHQNPPMPYKNETVWASKVTVGAYTLSSNLVKSIQQTTPLPVSKKELDELPDDIRDKARLDGGGFYIGANPSSPRVGDLRITFAAIKPQEVSVVAQATGDRLGPYQAKAGDAIEMLEPGRKSAADMFKAAEAGNNMLTWILRVVGFAIMAIGLGLVFGPISTFADVIPFMGDILRLGTGLFAFVVAGALSFVTIAIAWIAYRPVIGILMLVAAVGIFIAFKKMGSAKKAA